MTRAAGRSHQGGFILPFTLAFLLFTGLLLATYLSVINQDVTTASRAVARAQALYLAEAGLDRANDALYEDWEAYKRGSAFPMQDALDGAQSDGTTTAVGTFEVSVAAIDDHTLQITSTGRSFAAERTLSLVVAKKMRPSFERRGMPGVLELAASYTDQDGVPDLLQTSGKVELSGGSVRIAGTLTGGNGKALAVGCHLLAGFSDVDGDGDLDLLVSDMLSLGGQRPGPFIPVSAASEEDRPPALEVTAADILGTGAAIPFLAQGWVWAPDGVLKESDPGVDVLINRPAYDGTRIVSWSEQAGKS